MEKVKSSDESVSGIIDRSVGLQRWRRTGSKRTAGITELSVTKFKYPYQDAELDQFLTGGSRTLTTTQPSVKSQVNDVLEKALAIITENLDSDDPQRRWEAAVQLLRFYKN